MALVQVVVEAVLVYDEDRVMGIDKGQIEELLAPVDEDDPDAVRALRVHVTDPQPFFGKLG